MTLQISSSEARIVVCRRQLSLGVLTRLIAADTVVLPHPSPGLSQTPFAAASFDSQEILEKPSSKADNLRMLLDLNGRVCEVVTGVTVGA